MASERDLFPDDASYQAHLRHMAELARQERLRKASEGRKKRPPKYGPRVQRAKKTVQMRRLRARIYADPVWHASYKTRTRTKAIERYHLNPEPIRERNRQYYWRDPATGRARVAVYREENRELVNIRDRQRRAEDNDRYVMRDRARWPQRRDSVNAKKRARRAAETPAQRNERLARERIRRAAWRAAKKAAQQSQDGTTS